ncbi:nuclear factor NF-kappa-B p105 subunit [Leptinotarsa decemlineata]|uniref:nuclear factor NF-kappa-B p105 subunit n=1 Tax=Leptinotarsa decemlineata TaxID=7539 RepID=UPI003D3047EB
MSQHMKRANESNSFGQTPLHLAVRIQQFSLVHNLIQKGANINTVDIFDNTPLSLACIEKPDQKMVAFLLHRGADVNLERRLHMDLFLECVLNCYSIKQLEIINLLIDEGINVNTTDKVNNRNCMHIVAITGYIPLAVFLLEKGAILNIKDNFEITPILLAKIHRNTEILKLFELHLANG